MPLKYIHATGEKGFSSVDIRRRQCFPLAPTAIRVPAVIAHQLKGLFRNVLGDGGNEFQGGKYLEILPPALTFALSRFGLVNNRAARRVIGDFLDRKWIEVSQTRLPGWP